jgi:hypothetical protein
MQQITFGESVKRTWASAWEAVTQMPLFMLGAVALYTALLYVSFAGRPVPGAGELPPGGLMLAGKVASLLRTIIGLAFVIKIHRFVLLREGPEPLVPLGGKPLARMLGTCAVIGLVGAASTLLLIVVLRPHHQGGVVFIGLIVAALWTFVGVRLSLIFPAIATGSRIDLRGAWHDSSGHFWRLFGVPFAALLPFMVCAILVAIVFARAGIVHAAIGSPVRLLLLAASQSVMNVVFSLVTAAAVAWLYRCYANRLPAPPQC